MIVISLIVLIRPSLWRTVLDRFIEYPYFHEIEIGLRLAFGAAFIVYADQTRYPLVVTLTGAVFFIAGVALLLMGKSRHRRLAVDMMERVYGMLRPVSVPILVLGVFLVYAAN